MLEARIEQDLKTALLSKDSIRVTTLRGLKSALLNLKVDTGKRESGLSDDEVIVVLSKEAKKRQESADLYRQGGNQDRADAELTEKAIIEIYLPRQLTEFEVESVVDEVLKSNEPLNKSKMGKIIAEVKNLTKGSADGATIARLVKVKLDT